MESEMSHSTHSASVLDAVLGAHHTVSRATSQEDRVSIVSDLVAISAHLQFVAGVAVALDLALRRQNAERDMELADCLRFGVIDSTARELERVRRLVEDLGGTLPAAGQ